MQFIIDLDTLALIQAPSDRAAVQLVEGKRGDDSPFEVIFVRNGVAEALPTGAVITFGAKQTGKYDSEPAVLESAFLGALPAAITATRTGDYISAISVTGGGRYYPAAPLVGISYQNSIGRQATAFATLTDGVVTAITITDVGAGYTAAPTVWIAPPSPSYRAHPSFNTTALNALFLIDGNPANDVEFVDLMAEFTWQTGSSSPSSSKTFIYRVYNDVLRGTEGTPLANPTPEEWLAAHLPTPPAPQTPATLGLVIGTDVQAYNSNLAAIAALATTPHGRSLLTGATPAATRAALEIPDALVLTAVPVNGNFAQRITNFTSGNNLRIVATAAGSAGNDLTIEFNTSAPGAGSANKIGNRIWVRLSQSSGAITSTLYDVAAIINGNSNVNPYITAEVTSGSDSSALAQVLPPANLAIPAPTPAITVVGQLAIATVGGVTSVWMAQSLTEWRQVTATPATWSALTDKATAPLPTDNTALAAALAAKASLSGAAFTGPVSASNLSGSNTGDQTLPTLASLGAVPTSRKIGGLDLSADRTLADIGAASRRVYIAGNTTAVAFGRYHTSGNVTISNPAIGVIGDIFDVVVATGTAVINGFTYSASRFPIEVICTAAGTPGTWTTPASKVSDSITVGASSANWDGATITGNQSFSGNVSTSGQFIGAGTGLTGTAAGLTAGSVTDIGSLTGPVTSVNRVTSIAATAITRNMLDRRYAERYQNIGLSYGPHNGLYVSGSPLGTSEMVRMQNFTPNFKSRGFKLVFPSWRVDVNNAKIDQTSSVTIRASIEYPVGVLHAVYFNGKRDGFVGQLSKLTSDAVDMQIPALTQFWIRVMVTCSVGELARTPSTYYAAANEASRNIGSPGVAAIGGLTVSGGVITDTFITGSGSGYAKNTEIACIIVGAGTGGSVVAITNEMGCVDGFRIVAGGTGYSTPTITIPGNATGINFGGGIPTDLTTYGTVTLSGSSLYLYGHSQILAIPEIGAKPRSYAVIGDSIAQGFNDTVPGTDGWPKRVFDSTRIPFLNLALSSASLWKTTITGTTAWSHFSMAYDSTDVIIAMGTNDLIGGRTLAQYQTDFTALVNELKAGGIIRVHACTIPPNTNTANTVPASSESIRVTMNTWLRTIPVGLDTVFETADTLETSRNSGIWKSGTNSSDGVHPSPAGFTAMAAAFSAIIP